MKTKIIISIIFSLLVFSVVGSTQIKVSTNGKVSIDEADPQDSRSLNIYNSQTSNYTYGIVIKKEGTESGGWKATGVYSYINTGKGYLKGLWGRAYRSSPVNNSRTYGVRGMAGNYTSGWNYGVYGRLYGENNGAGIYGTIYGDTQVYGKYAGYFYGNVYVTGSLWANSITESDQRLKKDIENLSDREESLEKIMKLNPVKYKLKNKRPDFGTNASSDTGTISQIIDTALLNKEHFGFVAQELKKVYPDLVYTDGEGVMGINYIELIPVIVEVLKAQQNQINKNEKETSKGKIINLEERVAELEETKLKKTQFYNLLDDNNKKSTPILYQNHPNPFSENTKIKYYLPNETNEAQLYIYNMQGRQIMNYNIDKFGNGNISIEGGIMEAGMYMYTLIANGKEIDTKRMILTK